MSEPQSNTTELPAPQIEWDEADLQTHFANFCNVMGTREEMALLLGTSVGFNPTQAKIKVKVHQRILMNPYAAKRLYLLLAQGIEQYEARYGELKLD